MLKFPFHNISDNQYQHIQTLRWLVVCLFLLCLYSEYTNMEARKDSTIHVPPDLRSGAQLKLNDPKPHDIFSFALMITQMLNHWSKDGAIDYGKNIYSLSAYLTPHCAGELEANLKNRSGTIVDGLGTPVDELTGRVRSAQPVSAKGYKESDVTILGNGEWVVNLDLHIEESVEGMLIKSVDIRYPVRVIAYDVDRSLNPYGLAMDCYAAPGPSRLDPNRTEMESQGADKSAKNISHEQEETKTQ